MSKLLLVSLLLAGTTFAGDASLVWVDSTNPTGTSYSVYRANSSCSTATLFAKIASNVNTKAYEDSSLTPGVFCYKVTATLNGLESAFSNTAEALIPLAPPTALTVTER